MIFYILNDAPTIDTTTAKDAARQYALQNDIIAGQVIVSASVKVCDITDVPRDVRSTEV